MRYVSDIFSQWSSRTKSWLFCLEPLSSTDADSVPIGSVESIEADAPWIQVDKAAERNKRASESPLFQAGDGFNVLVDAARCLPDNVSITKVTVAALNSDRTRVEALDAVSFSSRAGDVYNPVFDLVRVLLVRPLRCCRHFTHCLRCSCRSMSSSRRSASTRR